jgi:preprotein translocase subunit SecG
MYTLLIVFYVLVSVSLIGLVLIQQGKGADAGAAFGSGASGTVFGSRGSANFLSRATAWLATIFFLLSLALAYVVHGRSEARSVIADTPVAAPAVSAPAPVTPTPATAVPEPAPKAPVTDDSTAKPVAESAKPSPSTEPAPTPKTPQ